MIALNRRSLALLVLLGVPSVIAGCADAPTDDDATLGESESPLAISPVRPPPGGGPVVGPTGPIGPTGPTWSPPVTLPTYFDTGSRTATSVGVGWYELVSNPHTQIWRQKYDLDDKPSGPLTLIKTFDNLSTGDHGFTDSAENTDDHSAPDTDRKNCYKIIETTGDCYASPGGPNCVATPQMACAFTRGAVPHTVGRVQLRIKVGSSSAAAAPSNAHIQVRLQSPYNPYYLMPMPRNNSTWIDSTSVDFQSNSNLTYDLKTTNISDLSDITMITIANSWSDDLCVNEIELLADNTPVYRKSFSGEPNGCAATMTTGSSLTDKTVGATFGELRRHPLWTGFNPPNLASGLSSTPRSFVGFRHDELVSYLDTAMGDSLKNPAAGLGDDAGLIDRSRTTLTWVSYTRLRVAQSIIAKDAGWNGNVSADVFYDLAIHTDAETCGAMKACIKIENVGTDSSFSGWSTLIPVLGWIIRGVVDNRADGEIQNALNAMGASSLGAPSSGTQFCFPSGKKGLIETPFASLGFGDGSLTACYAGVY